MIQAYDFCSLSYDKAPNEVDEYCRLEGVSPLLMRRSIAMKEKAELERRHDVLRLISIILVWLGKRMASAKDFKTNSDTLSAL